MDLSRITVIIVKIIFSVLIFGYSLEVYSQQIFEIDEVKFRHTEKKSFDDGQLEDAVQIQVPLPTLDGIHPSALQELDDMMERQFALTGSSRQYICETLDTRRTIRLPFNRDAVTIDRDALVKARQRL